MVTQFTVNMLLCNADPRSGITRFLREHGVFRVCGELREASWFKTLGNSLSHYFRTKVTGPLYVGPLERLHNLAVTFRMGTQPPRQRHPGSGSWVQALASRPGMLPRAACYRVRAHCK